MVRMVLMDEQWLRMAPYCLGKQGNLGHNGMNNRLFLEAVLWKARTASLWRDLPAIFGKWNTMFK